MKKEGIITWNLKEIVTVLTQNIPDITDLYLFGSRAYKTGSVRSDIDLLALTTAPLTAPSINSWIHDKFPPADLFYSYDNKVAISISNGSSIRIREKYANLPEQLDAIKLWDNKSGFSSFTDWNQEALEGFSFPMSIIPQKWNDSPDNVLENALKRIEETGISTFFAGSTVQEISKTLLRIMEISLKKPLDFQKKARNFSFDLLKIANEYDFQNYIQAILRPIFPDISPEPVEVIIDGNTKKADFALNHNHMVIEAKWIDSANKKDAVIKTLDGLTSFYKENPQIKSLLFLILYKDGVDLDENTLTARFEKQYSDPPVFVRFYKNEFV